VTPFVKQVLFGGLNAQERRLNDFFQTLQLESGSIDFDVSIPDGWGLYLEHCRRPEILGGTTKGTQKRYRAIQDKHIKFCQQHQIAKWSMINRATTEKYGRWMANVIIGLATTGMRIAEFAKLRWSDIDIKANTIKLTDERHSSRRKRIGNRRTTKGKRGRVLPLHAVFKQTLESIDSHRDGRVFHGPRGGLLKPDTVRNILIRELIKPLARKFPTPDGEIGLESGRLHSFRHFFVSESFRQGTTEAQIMSWVGHKDSKMVARYRQLRSDDSQRMMSQIDFLDTDDSAGPDLS